MMDTWHVLPWWLAPLLVLGLGLVFAGLIVSAWLRVRGWGWWRCAAALLGVCVAGLGMQQ